MVLSPIGFVRLPAHQLLRPDQSEPEIRDENDVRDLDHPDRGRGGDWGRTPPSRSDAGDNPHISYSITKLDLKYATAHSSWGWRLERVDTAGDVGQWSSIAVDAEGLPHISYNDNTGNKKDLKYAVRTLLGASTIETVDAVSDQGLWTSLALDAGGNPHIAYYNRSLFDLRYATRAGSGPWTLATIDSRRNVGRWTSIAVDAANSPHISYFDESNLDLKYARGVQ